MRSPGAGPWRVGIVALSCLVLVGRRGRSYPPRERFHTFKPDVFDSLPCRPPPSVGHAMTFTRRRLTVALAMAVPALMSCGGGGGDDSSAARPSVQPIPDDIAKVFQKAVYRNARWGLRVVDLALEALGPSHVLRTPVYRRGTVDAAGVLHGDLIVVASGGLAMSGRTNPDGSFAISSLDHNEANGLGNAILTAPDVVRLDARRQDPGGIARRRGFRAGGAIRHSAGRSPFHRRQRQRRDDGHHRSGDHAPCHHASAPEPYGVPRFASDAGCRWLAGDRDRLRGRSDARGRAGQRPREDRHLRRRDHLHRRRPARNPRRIEVYA